MRGLILALGRRLGLASRPVAKPTFHDNGSIGEGCRCGADYPALSLDGPLGIALGSWDNPSWTLGGGLPKGSSVDWILGFSLGQAEALVFDPSSASRSLVADQAKMSGASEVWFYSI